MEKFKLDIKRLNNHNDFRRGCGSTTRMIYSMFDYIKKEKQRKFIVIWLQNMSHVHSVLNLIELYAEKKGFKILNYDFDQKTIYFENNIMIRFWTKKTDKSYLRGHSPIDNADKEFVDPVNTNEPYIEGFQGFKSGHKYYAKHKGIGEDWVLIGIGKHFQRVCAAGFPPSIGYLSDMETFECAGELSEDEIQYRASKFGNAWI